MEPMRHRPYSRWLAATLFIAAGLNHFRPASVAFYRRIVPPSLPRPDVLVAVSGIAEIAGGLGLLVPRLRRPAGWGLIALLVAVFPANLYMARSHDPQVTLGLSLWARLARLPLQLLLILWVERASR